MSVGKFCAKGDDRCATFTTNAGTLWHQEAGEIAVDRVRNHYELECWIKHKNVAAPVQIGGSSGSAGEVAGHHVGLHPQRTDAEILMDAQPQGAYAPRADEEYIEPEILPVASLSGPPEPSKDEIEKHNFMHDPAMPWCDIGIQSKSRDDFHRQARPESPSSSPIRVRSRGYTSRNTTFRLHGRNRHEPRRSLGISSFSQRQRGSVHCFIDPLMVVRAWTLNSHHAISDGEPASEVIMRMVQSKGAMMENPPCEINQQQSQRYSHQSNGGAERMVQTIRSQIKAYKIQIKRMQESPSKTIVLYLLGYRDTQHGNTRDFTSDGTQQQQCTRRSDMCLTKAPSYLSENQ